MTDYEQGDRVRATTKATYHLPEGALGTVQGYTEGKVYIEVVWDGNPIKTYTDDNSWPMREDEIEKEES